MAMAQILTRERLAVVGDPRRGCGQWGGRDPLEAAELVRRDAVGVGSCLPMIGFCGGFVVPVVVWDEGALADRLSSAAGPMLYRSVLADRLLHGRDHVEPTVLRMQAFITVHPLPRARRMLAAVSGFARAVAAVPRPPEASLWEVFEADYYGFTVVEVDGAMTRTVVEGMPGPRHHLGGPATQRRLLEEQLFDVAVRTGVMPSA